MTELPLTRGGVRREERTGAPSALYLLPAGRRAAGTARHTVDARLSAWGVTGEIRDDAGMVASELAANAGVHGRGLVTLALTVVADRSGPILRLDVSDQAPVCPDLVAAIARACAPGTAHESGDWAETGRGLAVVAALADGRLLLIPRGDAGKNVRAELNLPAGWTPPEEAASRESGRSMGYPLPGQSKQECDEHGQGRSQAPT